MWFDTHCHLDTPAFADDRALVLARAAAAGVRDVLVPAIRPRGWDALTELPVRFGGQAYPALHVALGIHPQIVPELDGNEEAELDLLPAALVAANAVAVGECGLDGATGDHPRQEAIFARQIAIAREVGLPLLVHVLRAHDTAPRLMAEAGAHHVGGIMHSYSGSPELVARYRDLGFAFSFAGPVTYKNARKPLAAAAAVPDDLILVETDAPDQTPEPHRGGRCEPAHAALVGAALAAARGMAVADFAALTTANARRALGPRLRSV